MKEYKVIKPKLGWRNASEKLEEILNKYAKEGWNVHSIVNNQHVISNIVFERDKNR
tara:strand:- start:105673 stop:105840 length:168 start_codon:yes stop_codon:yes gene_type:complete